MVLSSRAPCVEVQPQGGEYIPFRLDLLMHAKKLYVGFNLLGTRSRLSKTIDIFLACSSLESGSRLQ